MTKDDRQKTENNWRPKAGDEVLLQRALMLKTIRAFFDFRGVMEVDTPVLSHFATTDPHLDSLQSSFRDQVSYLNTSPEYAMKRLLAANHRSIYQICKAFRDDELGPYHNPEFTMLEWYRTGYDMEQLMDEVAELVAELGVIRATGLPFERLSYQQVFTDIAGINPHRTNAEECRMVAIRHHVEIPLGMETDNDVNAWLDWLLMQLILPAFDKQRFTFLYDYPASQCALAKIDNDDQQISVAKRFELFFGEIELANGYHELTEVGEQLRRFRADNQRRKQMGRKTSDIDENFIRALDAGLPECAGVAIGLDRLLMVLTGAERLDQVLAFSWENA